MSAKPGDPSFVEPSALTGERRDWHDGAVMNKAHRLLTGGRVRIIDAGDGEYIEGLVRGDTDTYTVIYSDGEWTCSCPSSTAGQRCSHQAAVRLVTEGDGTS